MSLAAGSALRLRLPATSANLGPGFDTLALALDLFLEVEAVAAERYSIEASGRNREICSRVEGNLLLSTYRDTVQERTGREATPLALTMHNGIPVGMGCGSSAASRLAGVALAAHFGEMSWTGEDILAEAARLEGHPDNAAACWLGGFVASGWDESGAEIAKRVAAISIAAPAQWRALLVLPDAPLATTASRAVLPDHYSRRDTVLNLQRVAVLTAAFATGRGDLLAWATQDALHQPYRSEVCPLLSPLLPLAGREGILAVTLSGAGPSVLMLLAEDAAVEKAVALTRMALAECAEEPRGAELLACALVSEGADVEVVSRV